MHLPNRTQGNDDTLSTALSNQLGNTPIGAALGNTAHQAKQRALGLWQFFWRRRPPRHLLWALLRLVLRPASDRTYLKAAHFFYHKRWPNFDTPRNLFEHIQAYILRCRDPLLPLVADKLAVRSFIAERVGSDYLVPLIGSWERAPDVPLENLPRPCVLKPTHGSGMVHLLRANDVLDGESMQVLQQKLQRWLATDYSRANREWYYRDIPRRILAEQMLTDETGDPPADIKAYVIGGAVRYWQVERGRFGTATRNFYSPEWLLLSVQCSVPRHAVDPRPVRLDDMLKTAVALAAPFEFLRVDFYVVGNAVYVGELTNSPGAGFGVLHPHTFAEEMGRYWSDSRGSAARARCAR